MIQYLIRHYDDLLRAFAEHLQILAVTLVFSLLIAAALTILAVYFRRFGEALIQIFSVIYSIPSLALFALLIPLTGLGMTTTVIVLTAYNQYLLLGNFTAGIFGVDSGVTEAARGIGMSTFQILVKVQIPLAKKALFTGIELSVVSTIGIATIAAMINAGGLGILLFDGLRTMSLPKLLWGIILTVALSLLVNLILYLVEELVKNESVS